MTAELCSPSCRAPRVLTFGSFLSRRQARLSRGSSSRAHARTGTAHAAGRGGSRRASEEPASQRVLPAGRGTCRGLENAATFGLSCFVARAELDLMYSERSRAPAARPLRCRVVGGDLAGKTERSSHAGWGRAPRAPSIWSGRPRRGTEPVLGGEVVGPWRTSRRTQRYSAARSSRSTGRRAGRLTT